jgi:hypothetical protein
VIAERARTCKAPGCLVEFLPKQAGQEYHDYRCATASRVRRHRERAKLAEPSNIDAVILEFYEDLAALGRAAIIGGRWSLTDGGRRWFGGFAGWFDEAAA